MKLGQIVLLEIVSIVQQGILMGQDISQKLRNLDLELDEKHDDTLTLSFSYLNNINNNNNNNK